MKYNVIIILIKTFLGYFNINLLDRKVDFFDIIIIKDKLKIINEIAYLNILKDFKYYFKFMSYLYNLIYYYVQLASLLQKLKTRLLKNVFIKNNP